MSEDPIIVSRPSDGEVGDLNKSKIENYNMDEAIGELSTIINESSNMYLKLKQAKFDYLVQTCELYLRVDFPAIMMEATRKEVCTSARV